MLNIVKIIKAKNLCQGNSVLCLTPSESKGMLKLLKNHKPPMEVNEWKVNVEKMSDITPKLRSISAEREDVKGYAQRAFVAYCKSIHLQKNKKVFKLDEINLQQFASSLGLAIMPRLVQSLALKTAKNSTNVTK